MAAGRTKLRAKKKNPYHGNYSLQWEFFGSLAVKVADAKREFSAHNKKIALGRQQRTGYNEP